MKDVLRFMLEVEIQIDGRRPSDEVLRDRFIDAMNEGFPSMAFDDDELDCAVFVNSWCYEEAKDLNIGKCQNCGHEHEASNDQGKPRAEAGEARCSESA